MKKNRKRRKAIAGVLLYGIVFFLALATYSARWALNRFAFISFDEVLFQLTSSVSTTESSTLSSFVYDSLFVAILVSIIVFGILVLVIHYISCDYISFDIMLFKKLIKFRIKTLYLRILLAISILCAFVLIVYNSLDKVNFVDYVKEQSLESTFIEENYVDPKDTKIVFPEKKRNLIYIYVESLESTFFSNNLGGESEDNLLASLTDLTKENIYFSDTDKFGGAYSVTGTTWTSGAIVAQTAGLPLKVNPGLTNDEEVNNMLGGAYTLGDILNDNGYKQMFMIGSSKKFGNRGVYFEQHGNYDIYDYDTAKEDGKISKDYYVWWGFEDSKLFTYAKEELTKLAKEDKPFNFTMLTANTHATDGYLEESCPVLEDTQYENTIYCSANQVNDFVRWIQKQSFYNNTTIVIAGDHVSMQADLYDKYKDRRIYNLFINSAVKEGNFFNREFSTMDLFPTTLASLGAKIDGDRLALGTNLFSDKKTLMEENGYYTFNSEVARHSNYYLKEFLLKK